MSAALCLTMALAGAQACPPGTSVYGGYSYGAPYGASHYAAPSYAGPSYSAPGAPSSGYPGQAMYASPPYSYGGQQTYAQQYGYAAPAPGARSQPGYASPGPQAPYGYPAPQGRYGAGSQPTQGSVVQMTDRARFEPALITINAGETVEWINVSRHPHTVTADPSQAANPAHVVLPQGAQPINSGEIPPGQRFTHTFQVPGIYFYVCLPHEERGMVGIVVVNPGRGQGGQSYNGGAVPGAPPGGGQQRPGY